MVVYVIPNHARTGTAECWLAFAFRGIAHSSWELQSWCAHPHVYELCCMLMLRSMLTVLSPNESDARHDDTLQRIYSAANEDVEMKVSYTGQRYVISAS